MLMLMLVLWVLVSWVLCCLQRISKPKAQQTTKRANKNRHAHPRYVCDPRPPLVPPHRRLARNQNRKPHTWNLPHTHAHTRTHQFGPKGILHICDNEEGIRARNTMHNRVKADAFVPAGGRPGTINASNWRSYLDKDGRPSSSLVVEG